MRTMREADDVVFLAYTSSKKELLQSIGCQVMLFGHFEKYHVRVVGSQKDLTSQERKS